MSPYLHTCSTEVTSKMSLRCFCEFCRRLCSEQTLKFHLLILLWLSEEYSENDSRLSHLSVCCWWPNHSLRMGHCSPQVHRDMEACFWCLLVELEPQTPLLEPVELHNFCPASWLPRDGTTFHIAVATGSFHFPKDSWSLLLEWINGMYVWVQRLLGLWEK